MKAIIETAFPICTANNCITELKAEKILIQDPKSGKCIITSAEADANFTIQNPQKRSIAFVAIDKCIWGDDSEHKKCDFAITDSATFAFVEIKNTDSRTSSHKKHAKEQLETTIQKFKDAAISFAGMSVKAIISWKYVPTRPVASTTMQDAKVHFWKTHQVSLEEGNKMQF